MRRRDFLAVGAGVTVAGGAAVGTESTADRAVETAGSPLAPGVPAILASYSAADHRSRLENIALCQQAIRECLRQHLVTDYLPGQCCYNLCEYPAAQIWNPDEWDERELDGLREHGIRLIQVHEEWNDSQRLFGSHKLAPANPMGFRRFVDMVHRRDMRIIVYVSSGYFQRTDPDFRPEWATPDDLREIYFRYAHCSPASPGWRAYFLPRVVRILEDYGVDGIYNDLGYVQPAIDPHRSVKDQVLAFEESATHDGALEDFLGLIYAEVKRRGGTVKVHREGHLSPNTVSRVYDYLWVGEGGKDGDRLRESSKNHRPYVVPCLDMSRARIDREDDLYLNSVPYLQFPLLLAGRPFTGQRATVPGIEYPPEEQCFWTRHLRAIWRYYQSHPNGPHSYGWWDSVPGRPEARPTNARWLRQYLPLVEEGTWVWMEIRNSALFRTPLPEGVVASAFANRELYLVLANYGRSPADVATPWPCVAVENPVAGPGQVWRLPTRALLILRRVSGSAAVHE